MVVIECIGVQREEVVVSVIGIYRTMYASGTMDAPTTADNVRSTMYGNVGLIEYSSGALK